MSMIKQSVHDIVLLMLLIVLQTSIQNILSIKKIPGNKYIGYLMKHI